MKQKISHYTFDIHCVTTPRAMAFAVAVAGAATILINATINAGLGSPHAANVATPAHYKAPRAQEPSAPQAVPVRDARSAQARF
jgi:hypothetical protein